MSAVESSGYGRGAAIVGGLLLLVLTVLAVAQVITPETRQKSLPSDAQTGVLDVLPVDVTDAAAPARSPLPLPLFPRVAMSSWPDLMVARGLAWQLRVTCSYARGDIAYPRNGDITDSVLETARCLPETGPLLAAARPAVDVATPVSAATLDAASSSGRVPAVAMLSALPISALATAPAVITTHPRLLLDSATLAALSQNATANTPEWQQLKATCDSFIGGTVGYPTDNAYPNLPNLGAGYQGESYLPALLAEGMCYQVLKPSNPTAAASYGAKAVDILVKMSTPYTTAAGNQGQNPCTDNGYGIRFFGVGYGLGYDWVYDLLSSAQRTQIYTTANAWLTAWENPSPSACANFEYVHPQSNYFAGYFHAKAVIALATYGDNPSAPAQWSDWFANQFGQRVQPYYALHLLGGGWPEGFGNYATLAIQNMSLPAREVKTATGQDLVHASAAYGFPLDSADYVMHFTWPSRAYFDDRDTNHANGIPTPPVGTTQIGLFEQILGEVAYWGSPKVAVLNEYLSEAKAATSNYNPADPWLLFLETTPSAPTAALSTLPSSYLAPGLGAVAARSDWTTGASWMSFRAGPYVNNPSQGEEGYDQGSLALVRGSVPLLVNGSGWIVHEPNGSSDENLLYNDQYGSFNNTIYMGNRQIYNIYYVRNMSGSTVVDQYGQAAYTTEGNQVRTAVSAYEDGTDYVYVQATHLEDMYRAFSAGKGVAVWSRQIVYLRPDRFVVYDRTTEGSAGYDQFLAWHFPASPVAGSAASGQNRLDVTYNGTYAGAMTTVLPANTTTTTVPMYPTSNPVKVWQVQVRAPNTNVSQQWLTVFDLSTSATAVAATSPVTVTQGAVVGVRLAASDGNSVVIGSSGTAGVPIAGAIAYSVPVAVAHHVITELAAATGYNIAVSTNGSTQTITVSPGGTYVTSGNGVLDFYVNAGGTVQQTVPVISTLPISSLPVTGFPKPYKP